MAMQCDKIFSYLCDYLLICFLPCLFNLEGIQTVESHRDKAAVGVIDNLNVFPWRQLKTTLRAAKIFWSFPYRQKKEKKRTISRSSIFSNYAGSRVTPQCLCVGFVQIGVKTQWRKWKKETKRQKQKTKNKSCKSFTQTAQVHLNSDICIKKGNGIGATSDPGVDST